MKARVFLSCLATTAVAGTSACSEDTLSKGLDPGTINTVVLATSDPSDCVVDLQGADDEPGQKDLSELCETPDTDPANPFDRHVSWNFDNTAWSGNNTGDACALYDSDGDTFANFAVCVTVENGPPATMQTNNPKLYSCGNDRVDRCTNSVLIATGNTVCMVNDPAEDTDPFAGDPEHTGSGACAGDNCLAEDAHVTCWIDEDDFQVGDVTLTDVCSFPSQQPNSDPSDCIITPTGPTNPCEGVVCDDGAFCNGLETCDPNTGACLPGTAPNCGDSVGCTVDACNEDTDSCDNTPVDANCDDGAFCNGAETCDPVNDCQAGTAPDCGDSVGCTVDACNEDTDSCDNTPVDAICDDGAFCNGAETCDPVNDCQAGTAPNCGDSIGCTVDACNEDTDSCDNTPVDAICDDGAFCNGAETCDPVNDCQAGTAPNCGDSVGCTVDACNEDTDSCDNTPVDAICDDGAFCNGAETCDPVNDCQAGTAPNCGDSVGCTVDACNEDTDSCDNTPVDANCDDGAFCNGAETCDPVNDCQAGTAPNCGDSVGCTVDACNEDTDSCDNTPVDANCDDGAFCNGAETCDPVNDCQAGTAPDCGDSVGCTVDACNEDTDSCDNTPVDANCDDGAFCNGAETCDPVNDCQAGTAPDCGDTVGCTVDACNEDTDSCDNTPVDANCDDGAFCNGTETCDPVNDCQAGTAPDCGDSVGCTVDACNEDTDSCDNTPVDANCDDGAFCNGAETCDPVNDCQAGTAPDCGDDIGCTVDTCNEDTDSCDNSPSDAICQAGDVCLDCVPDSPHADANGCSFDPDNDPICVNSICRTPGFWGTHENVTQAVLDLAGGATVCGVHVDDFECAVEGLCNKPRGDTQLILARQLLAMAINCNLSTGFSECEFSEVEDLFTSCDAACIAHNDASAVQACISQIDCYNNGGQWTGLGCATGLCSEDGLPCGGDVGACAHVDDGYGGNINICVDDPASCHNAPLVNDRLGASFEPPGPASPRECRAATKSDDTLFTCGG